MMMMIDDIRVKVAVMIAPQLARKASCPKRQKWRHAAKSCRHVAKSYVLIDRCVVATQMLNWWCGTAHLSIAHLVPLSCDASEPSRTSGTEADDQVVACVWIASCRAIPRIHS